jgi:hypothetical protein
MATRRSLPELQFAAVRRRQRKLSVRDRIERVRFVLITSGRIHAEGNETQAVHAPAAGAL